MAIIWGYRRGAARDLGPALAIRCSTCAELEFWHLHRSVTWFTIFFIPLIPLLRQHFLLCPKCGNGMELEREGGTRRVVWFRRLLRSREASLEKTPISRASSS